MISVRDQNAAIKVARWKKSESAALTRGAPQPITFAHVALIFSVIAFVRQNNAPSVVH